jgi:hypothetical protein
MSHGGFPASLLFPTATGTVSTEISLLAVIGSRSIIPGTRIPSPVCLDVCHQARKRVSNTTTIIPSLTAVAPQ